MRSGRPVAGPGVLDDPEVPGDFGVIGEEAGEAGHLVAGCGSARAQDDQAREPPGWVAARVGEIEVGGDETALLSLHGCGDVGVRAAGEVLAG